MRRICKEQRIKERQQSNKRKKPRRPLPPVDYAVVADNHRTLRLRNGTALRQAIPGVGLYLSQGGRVYSLTAFGLRPRRIRFLKKNNYGKKTVNGVPNGQRYPYVDFRGKKYDVHILVTLAWLRPRREGEEIDHINGNIDDCRLVNLRIVTKEENRRCAQILRRLRNASVKYNLSELNPRNMSRKELLERFERYKDIPGRLITQSIRMEAEFILSQK